MKLIRVPEPQPEPAEDLLEWDKPGDPPVLQGRTIHTKKPVYFPFPYWAQGKGETDAQYAAFRSFLLMPYGAKTPDGGDIPVTPRNFTALADYMGKDRRTLQIYSAALCWKDRAAEYDRLLRRAEDRARLERRMAQGRVMEERAMQLREDAAHLYQQVLGRVYEMLSAPVWTTRVEEELDVDGNPTGSVVHVHPAGWNQGTIAKLIRELGNLGEIAAGTDQKAVLDKMLENIDPNSLTSDQRKRILNGEHPISVIFGPR